MAADVPDSKQKPEQTQPKDSAKPGIIRGARYYGGKRS